jgi:hypothetical protein
LSVANDRCSRLRGMIEAIIYEFMSFGGCWRGRVSSASAVRVGTRSGGRRRDFVEGLAILGGGRGGVFGGRVATGSIAREGASGSWLEWCGGARAGRA